MHLKFASLSTPSFVVVAVAGALALFSSTIHAQNSTTTGSTTLSIGYLSGSDFPGPGGALGIEHGILQLGSQAVLAIGAIAGYRREDMDNHNRFSSSGPAENRVPMMGTANVHVVPTASKRLDLWGGVSVGVVRRAIEASNGTEETKSGNAIQIGARLQLARGLGVFGQASTGDLGRTWFGGSLTF